MSEEKEQQNENHPNDVPDPDRNRLGRRNKEEKKNEKKQSMTGLRRIGGFNTETASVENSDSKEREERAW